MNKNTKEQEGLLSEIRILFAEAEGCMKAVETREGLVLPSVNQLRYAGQHLLAFLVEGVDKTEELRKVKRHCQRAVFDALDIHIQTLIASINDFEKDFENIYILGEYPQYLDLTQARDEAIELLYRGQQNHDRWTLYKEISQNINTLKTLTKNLPTLRQELLKLARQEQDRAKKTHQATIWATAIGTILGAVLGATILFLIGLAP